MRPHPSPGVCQIPYETTMKRRRPSRNVWVEPPRLSSEARLMRGVLNVPRPSELDRSGRMQSMGRPMPPVGMQGSRERIRRAAMARLAREAQRTGSSGPYPGVETARGEAWAGPWPSWGPRGCVGAGDSRDRRRMRAAMAGLAREAQRAGSSASIPAVNPAQRRAWADPRPWGTSGPCVGRQEPRRKRMEPPWLSWRRRRTVQGPRAPYRASTRPNGMRGQAPGPQGDTGAVCRPAKPRPEPPWLSWHVRRSVQGPRAP